MEAETGQFNRWNLHSIASPEMYRWPMTAKETPTSATWLLIAWAGLTIGQRTRRATDFTCDAHSTEAQPGSRTTFPSSSNPRARLYLGKTNLISLPTTTPPVPASEIGRAHV